MTAGLLQITPSRRRVAIAGKVVDAAGARPIMGAAATITSGPAAFEERLEAAKAQKGGAWDALAARLDRAVTAADGCFAFADLPDGDYTVAITAPAALRYGPAEQRFTVQRDEGGDIAVTIAQIPLPPTGARGTVIAFDTSSGMSLARVRVEGSGEVAYCDADGAFLLAGIQPGSRRFTVTASGYRRGAAAAEITLGEIAELGTIPLQPAGA